MTSVRYMVAAAALAFTMPVHAGVNDPEVVIYRASGVADNAPGGATATSFSCTNFSGVPENIRVVVRKADATVAANQVNPVSHLNTIIYSTSDVTIFTDVNLATGAFGGGTVAIAATSINVTCTGMLLQFNTQAPEGIQLHMTRFNPITGTQE